MVKTRLQTHDPHSFKEVNASYTLPDATSHLNQNLLNEAKKLNLAQKEQYKKQKTVGATDSK